MPKLGVFSGEEVCRILEGEGFQRVRQRGSDIVMQKSADQGATTIPVPNHRTVRIGTLQAILRQSGVPKAKFLR